MARRPDRSGVDAAAGLEFLDDDYRNCWSRSSARPDHRRCDSVRRWLPEFQPRLADGGAPDITIHQLLTHTAGLSYVLGAVIAKATGQSLPQAVAELVLTPLGMTDTGFAIADPGRLVAHYGDGKPEPRRLAADDQVEFLGGLVDFSPVRLLEQRAYPSGGAGMAGTAGDVLKFLETLRAGGLLQPETREAMFTVQAQTNGQAEGPGWEFGLGGAVLVDAKAAGTPQAPGSLQWNGAYGHKWFIDPANELTVLALTNTTFEGMVGRFPADVRNAVYGA